MKEALFDTHAHLDHKRFDNDRREVIERAFQAGVDTIVNPGTDLDSSRNALDLAILYPGIYAGVGFSPHDASKAGEDDYKTLAQIASHRKVVAWGEVGLDYHYEFSPRDVQRESLRRQIGFAKDLDLPLIFHQREAEEDFFEILEKTGLPKAGGVMHCFTADITALKASLALGLHISFSGVVTFDRDQARFADLIKSTPWDRLLVETDCPYMAPGKQRGKRCEPSMIVETVLFIAKAKNETAENAAERLRTNGLGFFRIGQEFVS